MAKVSTKAELVFGKVKWFGGTNSNTQRENKFGFITPSVGDDVFVHKHALKNSEILEDNDLVLFELENTARGFSATNVHKLDIQLNISTMLIQLLQSSNNLHDVIVNIQSDNNRELRRFIYDYSSEEHGKTFIDELIELPVSINDLWLFYSKAPYKALELSNKLLKHTTFETLLSNGLEVSTIPSEIQSAHKDAIITALLKLNISYSEIGKFIWEQRYRSNELFLCLYEKHNNLSELIDKGYPLDFLPSKFISANPKEYISTLIHLDYTYAKIGKAISLSSLHETLFDEVVTHEKSINKLIVKGYPAQYIPMKTFNSNIIEIVEALTTLDGKIEEEALSPTLKQLSLSAILYMIFKGVIKQQQSLTPVIDDLNDFLTKSLTKKETDVEEYVRVAYKETFKNFDEYTNHPVMKPFISPLLAKVKFYNRNLSVVEDIINNPVLWHDPEYWFLSKLIPLINPNNTYETIKAVILHELWQALLSGHIKVDHPSIFKLFPQCNTLVTHYPHMDLSCEAFSWQPKPTEDDPRPSVKYLCRSKVCVTPKVLPDLSKSIFEYSIFDWLAHYGVHYNEDNAPTRSDFPIQLPGYFNRIRELHERLQCRSCQKLMVPNFNYARVEAVTIDPSTGHKIITPVNAAYRLTVFHCNDQNCSKNGIGHYINHCLGFKCYEIIDSRDLNEKCSEGRYICQNPECRSCCPAHAPKPQHGISDNVTNKHKELYKNSPHFKSLKR